MKSFKDTTGHSWNLDITVGALRRVKSMCELDLTNIITLEQGQKPNVALLERLANDPILLVDVVYAVCKPECDQRNITEDDFDSRMSGDTIEEATVALLDEIIDFFPEAKRRPLKKILNANRGFAKKANTAFLNALDRQIEVQLKQWDKLLSTWPES